MSVVDLQGRPARSVAANKVQDMIAKAQRLMEEVDNFFGVRVKTPVGMFTAKTIEDVAASNRYMRLTGTRYVPDGEEVYYVHWSAIQAVYYERPDLGHRTEDLQHFIEHNELPFNPLGAAKKHYETLMAEIKDLHTKIEKEMYK